MCSPEIMAKVQSELTRRQALGRIGLAGAAAVAASTLSRAPRVSAQEAAARLAGGFTSVVDLTHTYGPAFPVYPGGAQAVIEQLVTVAENGYYKNLLTIDEHTGTHMDAPAHFIDQGAFAGDLNPDMLVAPLVVIHIHERAASDADAQGTPDDIAAWEAANGPIPAGAFVALHSGWDAKVGDAAAYINMDAENVQHYPGWHPDAAKMLVEERDIVGVGVDTLSLDYGMSADFATHVTILGAGKFGIENLANLGQVPAVGAHIVIGGPKHENASGGPTRALALV